MKLEAGQAVNDSNCLLYGLPAPPPLCFSPEIKAVAVGYCYGYLTSSIHLELVSVFGLRTETWSCWTLHKVSHIVSDSLLLELSRKCFFYLVSTVTLWLHKREHVLPVSMLYHCGFTMFLHISYIILFISGHMKTSRQAGSFSDETNHSQLTMKIMNHWGPISNRMNVSASVFFSWMMNKSFGTISCVEMEQKWNHFPIFQTSSTLRDRQCFRWITQYNNDKIKLSVTLNCAASINS